MTVLVCYDVNTQDAAGRSRLRRLATVCKDRGVRVQYSVFECSIDEGEWLKLRHDVLSILDSNADSLRFYFIDERAARKTEHHGVRAPLDLTAPLVL